MGETRKISVTINGKKYEEEVIQCMVVWVETEVMLGVFVCFVEFL